ncbi:MAG: GntR family transcriptional regulator [Acidobacteriaceae bacterium]|jgi:GntR family transcriptional regulator|nr:GntR family transcriptional regulator [Acidobacteriaceae bacterium]
MQISLSKTSDIPLRQQLAEQIVFLITTGQLRVGDEMPSVRGLARRLEIHHNTVSDAYQDLVRRAWLTGRRGSQLKVGIGTRDEPERPGDLDELINQSILRAKEMGYSLQALRQRVRERLLAEPPDHILVLEEEPGLRRIIQQEIAESLDWSVESCSVKEFLGEPGLAIGAQVVAPKHIVAEVKQWVPAHRPAVGVTYARAETHVKRIRELEKPSLVSVVSFSQSLLRTARSLLAPALGRKHTLQDVLLTGDERADLNGTDVAVCDSIALPLVSCRQKLHYQLLPPDCLQEIADSLASGS